MNGLDVNEEGYLVIPKDPREFLEGLMYNTSISLETGSDPYQLIDAINQLTAAFLDDMNQPPTNGKTH